MVLGKLNFRLSIGARGWIKRINDTPLKFLQEYLFSQGLNLDIRTDSPQERSKILWPSVIRVNLYSSTLGYFVNFTFFLGNYV